MLVIARKMAKDFSVRPEPVEGWTGESGNTPLQTVHASTMLSTNGLSENAISGGCFWQNPKTGLAYAFLLGFMLLPAVSQAVPRDANANNGAVSKLQAMVKSLTAERDAAKAETAALAGELEQLKKDKAAALAAKDSLGSELAAQKNSAGAVRNRLESTESRLRDVSDKYTQTSNTKAALEADLAALQAKQRETGQQLQSCGQHNVKLLQSAQELLERYQNKGRFAGLLQDEPLLQFHSVEVQNIAQEYQDRISAGEFAAKTSSEAQ